MIVIRQISLQEVTTEDAVLFSLFPHRPFSTLSSPPPDAYESRQKSDRSWNLSRQPIVGLDVPFRGNINHRFPSRASPCNATGIETWEVHPLMLSFGHEPTTSMRAASILWSRPASLCVLQYMASSVIVAVAF